MKPGGRYRPDATAWAVMALSAAGEKQNDLKSARSRLAASQMNNGCIPLSPDHPEAIWPTPLAVLAWKDSHEFESIREKATDFLLKTTGRHWPNKTGDPVSHDTALKGWPWISNTHSWVEPTALAVIALRATGYENHSRTREAVAMLVDRQLPNGGWNYGNRIVFGKELHPMPETTGMALSAVAGLIPESPVERSLDYLQNYMNSAQTPLTIGWGFLGLGAFGRYPAIARNRLLDCLGRQERYGMYDTTALSLLILAMFTNRGLINIYKESDASL